MASGEASSTPATRIGPWWPFVVLRGSLWSFVVLCGPLWTPVWDNVRQDAAVWHQVNPQQRPQRGLVLCGPLWSFVVLCGPLYGMKSGRMPRCGIR